MGCPYLAGGRGWHGAGDAHAADGGQESGKPLGNHRDRQTPQRHPRGRCSRGTQDHQSCAYATLRHNSITRPLFVHLVTTICTLAGAYPASECLDGVVPIEQASLLTADPTVWWYADNTVLTISHCAHSGSLNGLSMRALHFPSKTKSVPCRWMRG